jgi:hypothetical protein
MQNRLLQVNIFQKMKTLELEYKLIEGKTYSLFGGSDSTEGYYDIIRSLADIILNENEISTILETVRKYSGRKKYLKNILSNEKPKSLIAFCLFTIHDKLRQYTVKTNEHLKDLPFSKIWDRRLATTEEQYHLYMLEIELTNRMNRDIFLAADRKISLQPYCLQDFSVDCNASKSGIDYQCKSCSKKCFQNHASKILKDNKIEPYIWMGASISKTLSESKNKNQTIGIIGIACIPELVWGMRKCMKNKIPVIGIPLNANRCIRWFGEFHQNSVDLVELKKLVRNT